MTSFYTLKDISYTFGMQATKASQIALRKDIRQTNKKSATNRFLIILKVVFFLMWFLYF